VNASFAKRLVVARPTADRLTARLHCVAEAISKTAAGGEIDALDPRGYGALTITKSVTIAGHATMAGVLVAGTNGIVVQALISFGNNALSGNGSDGTPTSTIGSERLMRRFR